MNKYELNATENPIAILNLGMLNTHFPFLLTITHCKY